MLVTVMATGQYAYEPTSEHPYGLPNPAAPQELLDFAPLIGECQCTSIKRKADQTWGEPIDMIWRFKYIMNGMAVQDETLKADGLHSGSIRQFIPDSTRWYVHYYSSGAPTTILPVWEGNKEGEDSIVQYRDQKAPNGMDGFFKITFYDIDTNGFRWLGEWVSADGSVSFPTWKIECSRPPYKGKVEDRQMIVDASKNFSLAYMRSDYEAMADAYTLNAKIFPNNSEIIEGREAIKQRWILPAGSKILHHELVPKEINILGDYAFDYGYYQGTTKTGKGDEVPWKGKYVVVWKKEDGNWKMYLDIWNRVTLK